MLSKYRAQQLFPSSADPQTKKCLSRVCPGTTASKSPRAKVKLMPEPACFDVSPPGPYSQDLASTFTTRREIRLTRTLASLTGIVGGPRDDDVPRDWGLRCSPRIPSIPPDVVFPEVMDRRGRGRE